MHFNHTHTPEETDTQTLPDYSLGTVSISMCWGALSSEGLCTSMARQPFFKLGQVWREEGYAFLDEASRLLIEKCLQLHPRPWYSHVSMGGGRLG